MTFLGRGFADQTPLIPASRQYREREPDWERRDWAFPRQPWNSETTFCVAAIGGREKTILLTRRVCQASNLRARRRRLLTGGTRQSMTNHPARNAKLERRPVKSGDLRREP